MLAGVTLDLSAYAADFGKHLASMCNNINYSHIETSVAPELNSFTKYLLNEF